MSDLAVGLVLFAGGGAFGLVYLGLLWAAVRVLAGGGALGWYLVLAALRLGLVLGGLWGLAALGAGAAGLLIALAGFAVIRSALVRGAEPLGRKDA